MRERIKTTTYNPFRDFFPEGGKTPKSLKDFCVRHNPTGAVFVNKKQALKVMGNVRYNRALQFEEFDFAYKPVSELPDFMLIEYNRILGTSSRYGR